MCLHERRLDTLDHYAELRRREAEAFGGRTTRQRQGYCSGGIYDLRP